MSILFDDDERCIESRWRQYSGKGCGGDRGGENEVTKDLRGVVCKTPLFEPYENSLAKSGTCIRNGILSILLKDVFSFDFKSLVVNIPSDLNILRRTCA